MTAQPEVFPHLDRKGSETSRDLGRERSTTHWGADHLTRKSVIHSSRTAWSPGSIFVKAIPIPSA